MKKLSLVCCTFAALSLAAAETTNEPIQRVYCDVESVFQNSAPGLELAKWSQEKNAQLNELLSTKQNELRKAEQELATSKLPQDVAQLRALNLEHAKRQASLDIEKTKAAMEAELSQKMKSIEANIKNTIKTVAVENKWDEVLPKNQTSTLFFSEKLDRTSAILEAFNKASRAEAAKAVLRSPDSAKAPEFLKA